MKDRTSRILAAAATGPVLGGLAGLGALFLYDFASHQQIGGFLAPRLRLMLAQSLTVLEELVDLAYGRVDWAALENGAPRDASPDRV